MHPIFQRKVHDVLQARRALVGRWGWAILALVLAALLLLPQRWFFIAAALPLGIGLIAWAKGRVKLDVRQLARDLEAQHPELQSLLRTAMEIPASREQLSYLEERVIDDALVRSTRYLWAEDLTARDHQKATAALALGLMMLAGSVAWQTYERRPTAPVVAVTAPALIKAKPKLPYEITVSPGDTEVERGTRLVVEAKFDDATPDTATLVYSDDKGQVLERQPLRPSLDAKVFGGMISSVKVDGRYSIEFADQVSDHYHLTTYIHPELERADAHIQPPAY
jgi:cell division protein FtsB